MSTLEDFGSMSGASCLISSLGFRECGDSCRRHIDGMVSIPQIVQLTASSSNARTTIQDDLKDGQIDGSLPIEE